MKFEVYCDEALPDIFTSEKPRAKYLMIGALWLPADLREEAKAKIAGLRERFNVHGEMKWRKVSPSKVGFYTDLIDLFMSFGLDLRFRCIAVDRQAMNLDLHNGDAELGFNVGQEVHHVQRITDGIQRRIRLHRGLVDLEEALRESEQFVRHRGVHGRS